MISDYTQEMNSKTLAIASVSVIEKEQNFRKLEKAVAVRNSLLEKFSGKFRRCWKMILRFSGSAKCYPCQGLGTFRQGKRLLENWPRLRERCWIFSSETATAFPEFFWKFQIHLRVRVIYMRPTVP